MAAAAAAAAGPAAAAAVPAATAATTKEARAADDKWTMSTDAELPGSRPPGGSAGGPARRLRSAASGHSSRRPGLTALTALSAAATAGRRDAARTKGTRSAATTSDKHAVGERRAANADVRAPAAAEAGAGVAASVEAAAASRGCKAPATPLAADVHLNRIASRDGDRRPRPTAETRGEYAYYA
jgi:hypothetical protein